MINKPSNTFINVIFAVILLLGLLISGVIYYTGNNIAKNTRGLITQTLPVYDLLLELNNNIIEQERFLYEFYATEDENKFNRAYLTTQSKTEADLQKAIVEFGGSKPLQMTAEYLNQFNQISQRFVVNIRSDSTNWSLAREQLSQLTHLRSSITPQIQHLISLTKLNVQQSQSSIHRDLGKVSFFVVFYALASMFIVYSVIRAWKAYLRSSAQNERLSLFPKRNPNPVISLGKDNKVTFFNPACDSLLEKLGKPKGQAELLLASNIKQVQQSVLTDENLDSLLFEYAIEQRYFQCEIHWLADQRQWDLHLTDITARKAVEKELTYRASHDPDTGLKKRFELEKAVNEHCQNQQRFAFGLIEIRSYGQLISSSGLVVASKIVNQVGLAIQRLVDSVQEGSCEAYRIGEKSFAILCGNSLTKPQIGDLVMFIEQAIKAQEFDLQYQVTLDFGFACYPEHGDSYTDLHINAIAALDKSARTNSKDFILFTQQLGEKLAYQQKLTQDLKSALEGRQFELYFQPQLSLHSQQIVGAEVLIRWKRQDQWVSPAEFIPLAESAGLIIDLGDWILATACEKAKKMLSACAPDLVVAVNISPVQFARPDFLDKVTKVLKDTGLPAKNLELEITEGVLIRDEQNTVATLEALKRLGVKLAIDDFGTGYSSLSYLKKFNLDKLKIDQSFIRQLQTDEADQSIVKAIIELGRNLQLELIAEGVEELEQQAILQSMGCDEIQGYYFSRPLSEQDFILFLQGYRANWSI